MSSKSVDSKFVNLTQIDALMVTPDAAPRHERSDAVENRKRILDVAERLFAERGVENVCMQEIARSAGVGQGTLYRRFANKSELCLALLDTQMSDFQNEVLSTLREMTHRSEKKLAQLDWFLGALVQFNERHSPLLKGAQAEFRNIPPEAMGPRSSPMMWQRITASGLLNASVINGEARDTLDVPVVADALLGALHPLVFHGMRQGASAYSLERISAAIRQLVAGLKK